MQVSVYTVIGRKRPITTSRNLKHSVYQKLMTNEQMTQLLREFIPLCNFMEIEITDLHPDQITAAAPLAPNLNMHSSGFAGSLYSLAAATGWALLHNFMAVNDIAGQLVMKQASIHYKRPVLSDIRLTCSLASNNIEEHVQQTLEQGLNVDLPLRVSILSDGKKCAHLDADYVIHT